MQKQTTKTCNFFVLVQKGPNFLLRGRIFFIGGAEKCSGLATHCIQVLFRLEGSVVEKPSGRVESSFREKNFSF
jgi:hypothetical protein